MKTEDDAMSVKLFSKRHALLQSICSGFGGFDRAIFNHRVFSNITGHFCMTSFVSAPILNLSVHFEYDLLSVCV